MRLTEAPAPDALAFPTGERRGSTTRSPTMLDLLYVALTLAFFAAMLAYVAGCARLGRGATVDGDPHGRTHA